MMVSWDRSWNPALNFYTLSPRGPLLQKVLSQHRSPKAQNDKNKQGCPGRILWTPERHRKAIGTSNDHRAEWFQSWCLTTHALQPTYRGEAIIGVFFMHYPNWYIARITSITYIFSSWVFLKFISSMCPSERWKILTTATPNSGLVPSGLSPPILSFAFSYVTNQRICQTSLPIDWIAKEIPF